MLIGDVSLSNAVSVTQYIRFFKATKIRYFIFCPRTILAEGIFTNFHYFFYLCKFVSFVDSCNIVI